jgi:hypothetical protein
LLKRIFIAPPLAFARVGPSSTPCDAFMWGASDLSPKGTGQTTLVPTLTFTVAPDGALSAHVPDRIVFRDSEGIRPVAPFFELHGEWTDASGAEASGPLTPALLASWGATPADVSWSVHIANLKAYHYTREPGDRVEAKVTVRGDEHTRVALLGFSPVDAAAPLIGAARPLPMGAVQAPAPSAEYPELRLRFYPPRGRIYGPTDANERVLALDYEHETPFGSRPNAEWRDFALDPDCLIANPDAHWSRYVSALSELGPFPGADPRNTPSSLLAAPYSPIAWAGERMLSRSLGLVDDVGDGVVACSVTVRGIALTALARIVVGPPDFAPANRPPVSLADNLADREARDSVRSETWTDEELAGAVLDILERAYETSDLMHRDYQNWRSHSTNARTFAREGTRSGLDEEDLDGLLWPRPDRAAVAQGASDGLPISHAGTRQHRRYNALEFLADRLRENPDLIDQWVRRPRDPKPYFDKRMPALMRGSDGGPQHLTRRQYEIIRLWAERLRQNTTAAGAGRPGAGP